MEAVGIYLAKRMVSRLIGKINFWQWDWQEFPSEVLVLGYRTA
jgi:hypothetical protein